MIRQGILRLIIQTGGTSSRKGSLRMKKGGGGRDPDSVLLLRDSPCKVGSISLEGKEVHRLWRYFGHLMQRTDSSERTLMMGRIGGRRRG